MKGFTIRPGAARDLEGMARLFDGYRVFYRKESDLKLARKFIRDRMKRKESILLVAVSEAGDYLGFAQLYPSFSSASAGRTLILNDLFVIPAARNLGIGSRLIEECLALAGRKGCVRVDIATEESNHGARRLYAGKGFRRNEGWVHFSLALGPKSARKPIRRS